MQYHVTHTRKAQTVFHKREKERERGSIGAINRCDLTPLLHSASTSLSALALANCLGLSWAVEKGNLSFVVIVVVVLHSCCCRLLSPVTAAQKHRLKVVQQATAGCQVKRCDLSHAHPQNIINLSPNHLKSPASGPSPLTTLSPITFSLVYPIIHRFCADATRWPAR